MQSDHIFDYESPQYHDFLRKFRENETKPHHSLIVVAGEFDEHRLYAIDEMKREVIGEAQELSISGVITSHEQESFNRIDELFNQVNTQSPLIIFRDAEQINDAYTGFSSSAVRYATPQERYFLSKVKEIPSPVILEFNTEQIDGTLARQADSVILFPVPTSFLDRLAWKFRNVHVHGSRFSSARPVSA